MRSAVLVAFSVVAVAAGCQHEEERAAAAAPAAGPAAAPASRPPASGAVTAERARAVLDAWLAAQNGGDFAAYKKLYASRFEGVKRAGKRIRRFARAGWMDDRKRMFDKPMVVEAREPQVETTATTAQVQFTQRWQSGSFEDLGPKRLLLVVEGGALKIAREELLRSEVVSTGGSQKGAARDFGFLLTIGGETLLVLDGAAVPARRGARRLDRPHKERGFYVASAAVADGDLGPELAAWKGARVKTDEGCEAQVVGFRAIAMEVPHFLTVKEWQGEIDGVPKARDAEIAASIFTSGRSAVAAVLGGSCKGLYGQLADRPAIAAGEVVEDAALAKKAIAAFTGLPDVTQVQKEHVGDGGRGSWWKASLAVQIFKHPVSGQVIVSVKADNGGSCGELVASAWAIYEVVGGSLEHRHSATPPAEIRAAFDADGDGRLELVVRDVFGIEAGLVASDGNEVAALRYAYNDCPC